MAHTQETWQEIAARKRAAVRALIPADWLIPPGKLEEYKKSETGVLHVPRECAILSAEEIKITEECDAVALREELRTGRLSAVDVTRAFSKRAAVAQQLVI
jgi:amidase